MTVFRSGRRRILATNGLVLVVLAVWGLSSTGGPLPLGLAAIVLLVSVWVLRRPRLRVTEHAVTVANLFTTSRIPWSRIRGFSYGRHGRAWCVRVERTDGSLVPVRVLSDDVRAGGYSPEQTSEVVAKLRARLEAQTGIRDQGRMVDLGGGTALEVESLGGSDLAGRRIRRQLRAYIWGGIVLGLFFVGLGISSVLDAAQRPHVYGRLRSDGVRLAARFDGCGPVDRFDRTSQDSVCRLSVTYGGQTRRWDYGDDYPQFDHLAVGAPVPVLLDPAHPTTVFTVHDVATNDNSGMFSIVGLFGVGMIVLGVVCLAFTVWGRGRAGRPWRATESLLARPSSVVERTSRS
jgi:hypothetical protein